MYSLFTKIFLSFWLVALLLAASMFAAQHYLGSDAIEEAVQRTDAHAATVAALLEDEGMVAVERWIASMRRERSPLTLLDQEGRPLIRMGPRFREYDEQTLRPGLHPLRPGVFAVVRPVPNTDPPLYLRAIVRVESERVLSVSQRIVLAIVFSGVICLGLAALITRPIRRLRQAAQALAAGDLTARVPVQGRDEVAALAGDFNLMADRVRDLLESQQRLLRDVSHELRSPLARLRVALELSRKKGDPAAFMDRIEREADRLESLVSDLLSLARLEANQTHITRQPVALGDLVSAIAQDAAFEAEAAGKEVRATLAGGLTVAGDPVLLRSAIENVVRNGVRHTPAGSAVTIALRAEGPDATVEVRDQGEGVPEKELGNLFQPFVRVGEARDRASGGFGLGLAISRRAVEAHGGRIEAQNGPEGGLRVLLRLPLAATT